MYSADNPPPGAGGARWRPKWYLLYYLLAALDVATVLASLTLNHRMVQIYVDSVAMRQEWAVREAQYARLSELARAVNAPGNDVFDSGDVDAESGRLRLALKEFDAQLHASRDEVRTRVGVAHAPRLLAALEAIEQAMREMVNEADVIFDDFDSGQPQRAGARMATMDRKYANVGRALERLFGIVRDIEQAHLDAQLEAAEVLKRVEYLIMGLAILMIAGALFYGMRIYRASRAAETERLQYIDALTRARAAADAASEAKSRFVAMVSHELRTPLNTMLLTLDTLDQPGSREEQRACLAVARASGGSLKRLVEDVLEFSRIESGKVKLECVRFGPGELLEHLLAPYAQRAAQKGLSLAVRIAPQVPPQVAGDPVRFGQIVTNLVDNAVKFTAAGSVDVSVSLRPDPAPGRAPLPCERVRLRVAVRDTGIGVPAAQRTPIFEDFVQGDDSTTRKYGGAGLGLGIVRRLVDLMKGEFGVMDTPGGGSTFWFEVDLARDPGAPAAAPSQARLEWERTLFGRRVLLVEDAPEGRTVTAALLGQLGLKVDLATDAAQAVSAAAATRYDAILMDIGLPETDGFEATRRIRQGEHTEDEVPIIALTAQAADGILEQCLDAGMDDYLAKPVSRESIIAGLGRWLEPARAAMR
jgi:signal transduction histidine kinase/ActR/RegA family two-component response regulator